MPFPIPKPPATISKFFSMGNRVPVTACPVLPAPASIACYKGSMGKRAVVVTVQKDDQASKTGAAANSVQLKRKDEYWIAIKNNDEQTVRDLLAKGANPNKDEGGWTPLTIAVYYRKANIIEILLNAPNINVDLVNPETGHTPLTLAAEMGYAAIVKMLLDKGADPNVAGDSWTPLTIAAYHGKEEVVKTLISKRETDINLPNKKNGKTALKLATEMGHLGIVKLLTRPAPITTKPATSLSSINEDGSDEDYDDATPVTPVEATLPEEGAGAGRGP